MNSYQKPSVTYRPQMPDSPLSRFLARCRSACADEKSGTVANYIPELGKANPDHFGIALATMDGYVYAVGDADEISAQLPRLGLDLGGQDFLTKDFDHVSLLGLPRRALAGVV